jgi:hypothetical protein
VAAEEHGSKQLPFAATPLPWTGSSDLLGLAGAGCFVALPAGGGVLAAGSEAEIVIRDW